MVLISDGSIHLYVKMKQFCLQDTESALKLLAEVQLQREQSYPVIVLSDNGFLMEICTPIVCSSMSSISRVVEMRY